MERNLTKLIYAFKVWEKGGHEILALLSLSERKKGVLLLQWKLRPTGRGFKKIVCSDNSF